MSKKMIAVIFGGQSSEHIVSCMSAANIIQQIDKDKYDMILIGITQTGHWVRVDSVEAIQDGTWTDGKVNAIISPDATEQAVILIDHDRVSKVKIAAVFPVLHGLYGEDGTIQGLLELAKIPYVGCGVLSSAVSMDKLYTKIIVEDLGIRQAAYVPVKREDLEHMEQTADLVESRFSYPVFIKPSNAGSSKGVSKAEDRTSLQTGLAEAAKHDRKILVEEMIVGHEIECAVLGGGAAGIQASGVGEIMAAADFYDFDAKYFNTESKTVVNPSLPGDAAERVRSAAKKIFGAVDGYGLARVDFFVKADGEVVFNEINTMPGFTAISMYPILWESEGITKQELISRLIELAADRYQN